MKQLIDKGLSQREIANYFNVSQCKVRYWLRKYGLATNNLPYNKRRFVAKCSCGEENESEFYRRSDTGEFQSRCKSCTNQRLIERARKNKQEMVGYKGGKCVVCGYSKCIAALEFHHRDSKEKDPNFKSIKNWNLKRARSELDKCDLLCCRCHREKHAELSRSVTAARLTLNQLV